MADELRVPDHLPVLGAARHFDPQDGVCLMEYASVLAGEPFSDHPQCTHPHLAHVARLVNDLISDAARPQLAILAPDLIGTATTSPLVLPRLVVTCTRIALEVDPLSRRLWRQLRRAERHLDRLNGGRSTHLWAGTTALWLAVHTVASSKLTERNQLLARLLVESVRVCRSEMLTDTQPRAGVVARLSLHRMRHPGM
ncbi:hypothetical protein E1262_12195 [Jiangella aurantiaca]|uniref:Uncharacterized protein n=1 Tax=Jiangella aurantiaca TaxID=2530373 RepID=A0A4V6PEH7_9ACTN|nr:hypothetical protein [Jiangella aurantiaca]TDD69707.1 hypothetical protein E1262_12195 [Jiangella aurantiaca]